MKRNVIFIACMIAVLMLLFTLSQKKFPPIPDDADHNYVTTRESCNECHDHEGISPLKDAHPPKFECFKCHTRQQRF